MCICHTFSNVKVSMKPEKQTTFGCTVKSRINTFGSTDSAKLNHTDAKTCIFSSCLKSSIMLKKKKGNL